MSYSLPLSLIGTFVLGWGFLSTIFVLSIFILGIVTIIKIEGLAKNVDITLKVEIPSCCVAKYNDGGRTGYLADEVLITSINMLLSWIGVEIG